MSLLELRDVTKGFGGPGNRQPVLEGVRLEIEAGECFAVVGGPHGGKSTLLGLVAGLVLPDFGTLTLGGRPIVGPGPDRLFVAPACALFSWLSVIENLTRAVESANPTRSKEGCRREAERLLESAGLTDLARKKPEELSTAARKRVALARTLALSPDVLLLDEPFAGLDAATRASLQVETARMLAAERKTCLLATDDVEEAIFLADRVCVLLPGTPSRLSRPVVVDLPKPRDRRTMLRNGRSQELRELLSAEDVTEAGQNLVACATSFR